MSPSRSRRLLLIAIALSLLAHLIFATWVHWPSLPVEQSTQVVTIASRPRLVHIQRQVPHTPPPHTPAPQPPSPAPHKIAANPVVHNATGVHGPAPGARATPAPTPQPAATPPPCTAHNAPAALAATPAPSDIPPEIRAQMTTGTTKILVHLDAEGTVKGASIVGSSGNGSLDSIALSMARTAGYTPAYEHCKAVAGEYTFTAHFTAW